MVYVVCQAVGGVMEKPDFTYEDIELVTAQSPEEAIDIYTEKHGSYWDVVVLK